VTKPYRDYADFLADIFVGKVQKISLNTGLICPNRDGTIGRGGCAYCNNQAFSPAYGSHGNSVTQQLCDGKQFFARKYPSMRYLAYFQSYTSTHGNIDTLIDMYNEAADVPDVVGIIIGTRPDCMPDALLARLAELNRRLPVIIEYGAESSHDTSLRRVNRCHTWQTTVDAVTRTHAAGLRVGLHFILGLPGETTQMMMQTIDRINLLPVDTVKFHQLQIVRHTPLAADFLAGRIPDLHLFQVDEYIDLCAAIINRLRPDIAIERFVSQSPDSLLIAPRWGLKNYQFTNLLRARLTAGRQPL
jgi:hypothetical protein